MNRSDTLVGIGAVICGVLYVALAFLGHIDFEVDVFTGLFAAALALLGYDTLTDYLETVGEAVDDIIDDD